MYMGSANLSEAAWGRLTYDKVTQGPKLTARNWECGILMPVYQRTNSPSGKADDMTKELDAANPNNTTYPEGEVLPIEVFDRVFGVPFEYPPKRYEEGQLPWSAHLLN